EFVAELVLALGDKNPNVWRNAAEALGRIGVAAVGALVAALSDSKWQVRAVAAAALGCIGGGPELEEDRGIAPWVHFLAEVADALARPESEDGMALDHLHMRHRLPLAPGRSLPEPAVAALAAALGDTKWQVRAFAA